MFAIRDGSCSHYGTNIAFILLLENTFHICLLPVCQPASLPGNLEFRKTHVTHACVDDKDFSMIEVDSNEMDYFYADSCVISPSAFLLLALIIQLGC